MSQNFFNNNALSSLMQQAAPRVVSAIKSASAKTGVNFAYLMEQAAAESSFNASAKAHGSSATGLYQFIESTWLSMVKKYGDKYGLGDYADKISDNGHVGSRALRKEILDLRKDPEKAAAMAAELAADNKRYLDQQVGGDIGSTELYLAHFLGASGAAGFIDAYRNNPLETAADIFPRAAKANYNVFFDSKTGEARTLAGVYDYFAQKFKASQGQGMEAVAAAQDNEGSAGTYQRMLGDVMAENTAGQYVMRPFGYDSATSQAGRGWRAMPSSSLMVSPTEVMAMAQLKTPADEAPSYYARKYRYNQ